MSPKYSLNTLDWKKIGKGAIFASVGALGTYALGVGADIDWGTWAPVATALLSVFANLLNKFLSNNQ